MMPKSMVASCVASVLAVGTGAPATAQEPLLVTFQVTEHGLKTMDVAMEDRRLTMPRGQRIKIILVHKDKAWDRHQFELTSNTGAVRKTQPIAPLVRKETAIEFTVGAHGEAFYRLSCILPCAAMAELVDYVIIVGLERAIQDAVLGPA